MSFLGSVAVLTVVYLARRPARTAASAALPGRCRRRGRYLATDLAWYGVAIAATALSVFVLPAGARQPHDRARCETPSPAHRSC